MLNVITLQNIQSLPNNSYFGVSNAPAIAPFTYTSDPLVWQIPGPNSGTTVQASSLTQHWNSNGYPPLSTSLVTGIWQDVSSAPADPSYVYNTVTSNYLVFNIAPHAGTDLINPSTTLLQLVNILGDAKTLVTAEPATFGPYTVSVSLDIVAIDFDPTVSTTQVLFLVFDQTNGAAANGFRFLYGESPTTDTALGIFMARQVPASSIAWQNPTSYLRLVYGIQALPFEFAVPVSSAVTDGAQTAGGTANNVGLDNDAFYYGALYWQNTNFAPTTQGYCSSTLGFSGLSNLTGTRYFTAYIAPGTKPTYSEENTGSIIFYDNEGAPCAFSSLSRLGTGTQYILSVKNEDPYVITFQQTFSGETPTVGLWIETYQNNSVTNPLPSTVEFSSEYSAPDAASVLMMVVSDANSPSPPACFHPDCVVHVWSDDSAAFIPTRVKDIVVPTSGQVRLRAFTGEGVLCFMVRQEGVTNKDMVYLNDTEDVVLSAWHLLFVPCTDTELRCAPCAACKRDTLSKDKACRRCCPFFVDGFGSCLASQLLHSRTTLGVQWYHFVPVDFDTDHTTPVSVGSLDDGYAAELFRTPLDKVLADGGNKKWTQIAPSP